MQVPPVLWKSVSSFCGTLISSFILEAFPRGRRFECVASSGSADERLFVLLPSDMVSLAGLSLGMLTAVGSRT